MVATHMIKQNGKVYLAGEEIPSPANKPIEPVVTDDKVEVSTPKKAYSKSDIMTMKVAKLRELAEENGIENADEYTGSELKEMLIDKLV